MQVANCTTPSNYFTSCARQLKARLPKPLILMTASRCAPQRAVSKLDEMGRIPFFIACCGRTRNCIRTGTVKLANRDQEFAASCFARQVYTTSTREREKRGIADIYLLRVGSSIRSR